MSLDKLVDSTQLDADLTSVANAIRTKGGTSAQLAFPADFISAIEAISGGGDSGEIDGVFYDLHYALVTVGGNSVTTALAATNYLLGLAGAQNPGALVVWGAIDDPETRVNNQLFGHVLNSIGTAYSQSGNSNRKLYRWRNNAMQNSCQETSGYDGKLVAGTKVWIIWVSGVAPT